MRIYAQQARPATSHAHATARKQVSKPATRPAAPRLASDARSAARRAFDEELAVKEAQLTVRPETACYRSYMARASALTLSELQSLKANRVQPKALPD